MIRNKPSPSLWILGLFLFFAAAVNLNDPDAYFWTPAYALGGCLSWYALLCPTNHHHTNATATTTTTTTARWRIIYQTYFVMSLAVAVGSFSLLWRSDETTYQISGASGLLGVFELEPVREGGGSLLMALAMYLCWKPLHHGRASQHQQQEQQHREDAVTAATSTTTLVSSRNTAELFLTTASGIVAAVAIFLGVILPQHYNRLGVVLPEHCGGDGGGMENDMNLLAH